jgi:hypothetical protein
MDPIPKSGLYYPNKIARIALMAIEDVMGKNGLNAILNLAGLSHLIDNYPPDNLERQFDFADFSAINGALEEMYGPRGGRGLALRAGRAPFPKGCATLARWLAPATWPSKCCRFPPSCTLACRPWQRSSHHQRPAFYGGRKGRSFRLYHSQVPGLLGPHGTDKPACFMAVGLAARRPEVGFGRARVQSRADHLPRGWRPGLRFPDIYKEPIA